MESEKMELNASLVESLSMIEDPRIERTKDHDLLDILVLSVMAVICGAEGWEDIETFGRLRKDWLRQFIRLRNGIPSHDTISRVFRIIRPGAFQEAFLAWVKQLGDIEGLNIVAIDGKSLRRSHDAKSFRKMLHTVCAFSAANHVVLGMKSVDEKSNEIVAIPELLKQLTLKGMIITIDAMGTQKEIAEQIVDGGADYVLAVKDNHPTLHAAIAEHFDSIYDDEEKAGTKQITRKNKGHGREETRQFTHSPIPESMSEIVKQWKDAKSIGQVNTVVYRQGKEVGEIRYYLSSLPVGVKKFAESVRQHWSIENSLHWVLDMTFNEDQSRIRKGNSAENFALLRRFALNIIRQDTSPATSKLSIRKRRKIAAWDPNYLLNIMATAT
jgi:predicted transposase YbfD/YdcC